MKALVVLLAILFGVWLFKRGQAQRRAARRPPPRQLKAQAMSACAHCGVHVPESSLVVGRSGRYCSAAHRQEAEGG